MSAAKYIIILLLFCSCRSNLNYNGIRVKFVSYHPETYFYSGDGWGHVFDLKYRVLKGNESYEKNEIITEHFGDHCIKIWMVRKKLGRTFNVIKNGYALSWHLYF